MPLNAKDARIFIKFNEDGTRDDTRIEGANLEIIPSENGEIFASAIYADGTYDEIDLTGYVEISYADYMLYCGNSQDGKEYRYDAATKKPKEYVYTPSLEELQKSKIAELKAARDTEEVEPIEYNGNLFDYDEKARDRIKDAITLLDMTDAAGVSDTNATIEWTTAENTDVLMTADDLRGVIAAVGVRSNALHVKCRKLKAQVETAKTAEEIEAINW